MSLYLVAFLGGRSYLHQHIVDRGTEGLSNELPIQLRDYLVGRDGMDCGYESLHDASIMDELDGGWGKRLSSWCVVQEVLLTALRELSYLYGSHPSQTWGHSQKGQQ